MKYFLIFWLLPVGGLAAWLYLAANDMNFGIQFLSRDMYDLVFGIYANILGVDAATLPPLIWKALVVDTLIVLAILAFRRRKVIATWLRAQMNGSAAPKHGEAVERTLQDEGSGSRVDTVAPLRS